jgi:hypothetical protein
LAALTRRPDLDPMLALLTLPVQKEPDLGPCAQRMLALWPDLSIGLLGCEIAKVAAGARSDPPPVNVDLLALQQVYQQTPQALQLFLPLHLNTQSLRVQVITRIFAISRVVAEGSGGDDSQIDAPLIGADWVSTFV